MNRLAFGDREGRGRHPDKESIRCTFETPGPGRCPPVHAPGAVRRIGRPRFERLDRLLHPKIPRNVSDQILHNGKAFIGSTVIGLSSGYR